MKSHLRIDGEMTTRLLPYLLGVMHWLAGEAPGPPRVPPALLDFVDDELRAEEKRKSTAPDQPDSASSSATADRSRPPPEAA